MVLLNIKQRADVPLFMHVRLNYCYCVKGAKIEWSPGAKWFLRQFMGRAGVLGTAPSRPTFPKYRPSLVITRQQKKVTVTRTALKEIPGLKLVFDRSLILLHERKSPPIQASRGRWRDYEGRQLTIDTGRLAVLPQRLPLCVRHTTVSPGIQSIKLNAVRGETPDNKKENSGRRVAHRPLSMP